MKYHFPLKPSFEQILAKLHEAIYDITRLPWVTSEQTTGHDPRHWQWPLIFMGCPSQRMHETDKGFARYICVHEFMLVTQFGRDCQCYPTLEIVLLFAVNAKNTPIQQINSNNVVIFFNESWPMIVVMHIMPNKIFANFDINLDFSVWYFHSIQKYTNIFSM